MHYSYGRPWGYQNHVPPKWGPPGTLFHERRVQWLAYETKEEDGEEGQLLLRDLEGHERSTSEQRRIKSSLHLDDMMIENAAMKKRIAELEDLIGRGQEAYKRRGLERLGHVGGRTSRWLVHVAQPEGL